MNKDDKVLLSKSELAALDLLVEQCQEEGIRPSTVLFWPLAAAAVVAYVILRTVAYGCSSALPGARVKDPKKVAEQLKSLASKIEGDVTLQDLIDLRRKAVLTTDSGSKKTGKKK